MFSSKSITRLFTITLVFCTFLTWSSDADAAALSASYTGNSSLGCTWGTGTDDNTDDDYSISKSYTFFGNSSVSTGHNGSFSSGQRIVSSDFEDNSPGAGSSGGGSLVSTTVYKYSAASSFDSAYRTMVSMNKAIDIEMVEPNWFGDPTCGDWQKFTGSVTGKILNTALGSGTKVIQVRAANGASFSSNAGLYNASGDVINEYNTFGPAQFGVSLDNESGLDGSGDMSASGAPQWSTSGNTVRVPMYPFAVRYDGNTNNVVDSGFVDPGSGVPAFTDWNGTGEGKYEKTYKGWSEVWGKSPGLQSGGTLEEEWSGADSYRDFCIDGKNQDGGSCAVGAGDMSMYRGNICVNYDALNNPPSALLTAVPNSCAGKNSSNLTDTPSQSYQDFVNAANNGDVIEVYRVVEDPNAASYFSGDPTSEYDLEIWASGVYAQMIRANRVTVTGDSDEPLDIACPVTPTEPDYGDTVTWSVQVKGGDGANGYDYEWFDEQGNTLGQDGSISSTGGSASWTETIQDQSLTRRVEVTELDGDDETVVCSVTAPDDDTPPPNGGGGNEPTAPVVNPPVAGSCSSGEISVTWEASQFATDVSGFMLYKVYLDGNLVEWPSGNDFGTDTSFVFTGLDHGSTHDISVVAYDAEYGLESQPATLHDAQAPEECEGGDKPDLTPYKPAVNDGSLLASGDAYAVGTDISFKADIENIGNADVTSSFDNAFEIQAPGESTWNAISTEVIADLQSGDVELVVSDTYTIPAAGTYTVRISADSGTAVEESREDNNNDTAQFQFEAAGAEEPVAKLTAQPNPTPYNTTVDITWTDENGVSTICEPLQGQNLGFSTNGLVSGTVTSVPLHADNTDDYGNAIFEVECTNEDTDPEQSDTDDEVVRVRPTTPPNFSAVADASCESGTINLSWSESDFASAFDGFHRYEVNIFRAADSSFVRQETFDFDQTNPSITGLDDATNYTFRIYAVDNTNGTRSPDDSSAEVTASTPPTCGARDLQAETPTRESGSNTVGDNLTFASIIKNAGDQGISTAFDNRFEIRYRPTAGDAWSSWMTITPDQTITALTAHTGSTPETEVVSGTYNGPNGSGLEVGFYEVRSIADITDAVSEGGGSGSNEESNNVSGILEIDVSDDANFDWSLEAGDKRTIDEGETLDNAVEGSKDDIAINVITGDDQELTINSVEIKSGPLSTVDPSNYSYSFEKNGSPTPNPSEVTISPSEYTGGQFGGSGEVVLRLDAFNIPDGDYSVELSGYADSPGNKVRIDTFVLDIQSGTGGNLSASCEISRIETDTSSGNTVVCNSISDCAAEIADESEDADDEITVTKDATVTWHADVVTGDLPYDYNWSGDINPTESQDQSNTITYTDDGTNNANLVVNDADDDQVSENCPTVIVEDDGYSASADDNIIRVLKFGKDGYGTSDHVTLDIDPVEGSFSDTVTIHGYRLSDDSDATIKERTGDYFSGTTQGRKAPCGRRGDVNGDLRISTYDETYFGSGEDFVKEGISESDVRDYRLGNTNTLGCNEPQPNWVVNKSDTVSIDGEQYDVHFYLNESNGSSLYQVTPPDTVYIAIGTNLPVGDYGLDILTKSNPSDEESFILQVRTIGYQEF